MKWLKVFLIFWSHAELHLDVACHVGKSLRPNHLPVSAGINFWFVRSSELVYHREDRFFYQFVVHHIFVMICAPSSEEVYHRFAFKGGRELLSKALLKLIDCKESVFVNIKVFNRAPDFHGFVWLPWHNRSYVLFIDLLKALQFVVFLDLDFFLLNSNQVIDSFSFARESCWAEISDIDQAFT